jgi:hypothetical protein
MSKQLSKVTATRGEFEEAFVSDILHKERCSLARTLAALMSAHGMALVRSDATFELNNGEE